MSSQSVMMPRLIGYVIFKDTPRVYWASFPMYLWRRLCVRFLGIRNLLMTTSYEKDTHESFGWQVYD
jgi:hypothetical protein